MQQFEAPKSPENVKATGLTGQFIQKILLKAMYVLGDETAEGLSDTMKVSVSVIDPLLDDVRELSLVTPMGTASGDFTSQMRYSLTQKGIEWAIEALDQSQYVGPVPVPLEQFSERIRIQTVINERVSREHLLESFEDLVLPPALIDRLGPAANSGKSILLYGRPGNGKTCIAEGMGRAFEQAVYLPYAIEVDGQIINFYDTAVHRPVENSDAPEGAVNGSSLRKQVSSDRRWILCRRPFVLTGGELTLDMLDMTYNPTAKYYEAPLQMKATGGIFVIDDFGRQKMPSEALLNRWIIPLERRVDYLTLQSGKKFEIPFDELVVFSTNMMPHELADEAQLRRLYHKIEIEFPTESDFEIIFQDVCKSKQIELPQDVMDMLSRDYYANGRYPRSGYHPKFIVEQVIAQCNYTGRPLELNIENVKTAWKNLYTE